MAITLDITEIKKILPHRFPMLLVDRILDLEKRFCRTVFPCCW